MDTPVSVLYRWIRGSRVTAGTFCPHDGAHLFNTFWAFGPRIVFDRFGQLRAMKVVLLVMFA